MSMYTLHIKNVGQPSKPIMVYGVDGLKRRTFFVMKRDALEAIRIIEMLRTDTAFEGVTLERIDP